jgi:membrane-bound ClpP family serine protease
MRKNPFMLREPQHERDSTIDDSNTYPLVLGVSKGRGFFLMTGAMTVATWKRYTLFQTPGWAVAAVILLALTEWVGLSPWAACGLFAAWVIKDIAVYPLVRSAYESHARTGVERLVGEKGVTQEWLDPRGMVRVRGELWQAEAEPGEQRIEPNGEIRVTGAHGLTLIVSRAKPVNRGEGVLT